MTKCSHAMSNATSFLSNRNKTYTYLYLHSFCKVTVEFHVVSLKSNADYRGWPASKKDLYQTFVLVALHLILILWLNGKPKSLGIHLLLCSRCHVLFTPLFSPSSCPLRASLLSSSSRCSQSTTQSHLAWHLKISGRGVSNKGNLLVTRAFPLKSQV